MASRQAWQGGDPTEEGHGPFPPEAKETRLGDTLLKAERRTGFLAAPNSRRWPAGVLLKEITGKQFTRQKAKGRVECRNEINIACVGN